MHNFSRKQAFTLAEVLITLGIIGVVAALTIPMLMTHIANIRNSAILKEDYSILQQVMRYAYDDGASSAITTLNNNAQMQDWFDEYLLPYMKVGRVCYDESGCWSEKLTKQLNGVVAPNMLVGKVGQGTVCFILNNGSNVCEDDYRKNEIHNMYGVDIQSDFGIVMFVDVNGMANPNMYGKDVFIFVSSDDKYSPAGSSVSPEDAISNCKLTGTGALCANVVKSNGWNIADIKY